MVTQLLDSDRAIREGHHTVKIASSDGEGGGGDIIATRKLSIFQRIMHKIFSDFRLISN